MVVIDIEPIRERFSAVAPFLDERGRRLVAAAEAFAAGYGGIAAVALATGVGTDSQRPFALVIVSGLFTRLLISVFLMPVLYALVAGPEDRLEV